MKQIIKAFAKVNLLLNVFAKTSKQSKHQLQSIMCLDLTHYDEIIIENSRNFAINYYQNKQLIKIANDSISTGIDWLKKHFSTLIINYQITVFKHIPIGAGLGGESSDCACVLNYLLQSNNLALTEELKLDLALNVGSDVCFFLSQYQQAYVYEYGNKVIKLPNFSLNYLLALPNTATSTKQVFINFDQISNFQPIFYSYNDCVQIIQNKTWNLLQNNLLLSAFAANKELANIYQTLVKNYPSYFVYLNGSGSSFLLVSKSKL